MAESVRLSRAPIHTFLLCARRYFYRYVAHTPWPDTPLSDETETAVLRGQQFHQLIERHFLGLPVATQDAALQHWWRQFERYLPQLPDGQRLTELTLTIPIGVAQPSGHQYLLNGRFDLIIVGAGRAHIFDWKTGTPQDESQLRRDWQTRLYLAMLSAGSAALTPQLNTPLTPEQVAITYWYVQQPDAPRTITYSRQQHEQNWAELEAIVAQIDREMVAQTWPLTDDWSACRRCAYQVLCGRQAAGTAVSAIDADDEPAPLDTLLEPDLPA